ncbi:hypothetical protein MMC29_000906 [Sticta canariensis]|nr:hypothetical protein [Sticta canariensis]
MRAPHIEAEEPMVTSSEIFILLVIPITSVHIRADGCHRLRGGGDIAGEIVYVSCESAPRSFKNISAEVKSLHGLLKETHETILARSLQPASQARLTTILDGCAGVLTDLKALVDKYEALGKYKWTLDRIAWGKEDIGELRARLTSNMALLTGFLSTIQVDVISKLDHFMREYKESERAVFVSSRRWAESFSGSWPTWLMVQKKSEDIGITAAAFEANKNLIFS